VKPSNNIVVNYYLSETIDR